MSLAIVINGQIRTFAELAPTVMLDQVIREMDLKSDRIAIEHNGEIAQRARWAELPVSSGDRLEVVHFVGGGARTGMTMQGFGELSNWSLKGHPSGCSTKT